MPVIIRKVNGGYSVYTPNGVKAKRTSLRNAKRQRRLLNAVEHSDWRPKKRKSG
jgi:hypothetical protein